MNHRHTTLTALITTLTVPVALIAPSSAEAAIYEYKCNYYDFQQINGTKGQLTARPQVAANLMGGWGFNQAEGGKAQAPDAEQNLLNTCVVKSNLLTPNTTWPEKCSPQGMAAAMTATFLKANMNPQTWVLPVYQENQQALALTEQLNGLKTYKSPIIVPLYGQPDHFGTVRYMKYDDVAKKVLQVRFWDAGDPVILDDPQTDFMGNAYEDAPKVASGDYYLAAYYKVLGNEIIGVNDPMYKKYIFSYEPPVQQAMMKPHEPVMFAAASPLVDHGEMSRDLASSLVWDALDEQDLLTDREFPNLWSAHAGDAWEVRGTTPAGRLWHYYVVPLLDDDGRGVVGLVGLSAETGAFQQLKYFAVPRAIEFRSPTDAAASARASLSAGESLSGGALAWDPRCNGAHCREPLLPYYNFVAVNGRTRQTRNIPVPIHIWRRG